jgi:NAD(P)-dependent dehydrogenase (short-subunit alcohol dehydrogenase family)
MSEAKVAFITGVGSGLGGAITRRFARGHYSVGLMARHPDYIEELARQIREEGGKAIAVVGDVSRREDVRSAVTRLQNELGPVHLLVHNASATNRAGLLGTSPQAFESAWRVISLGAFLCAQETAPGMIEGGEGVMLFTGATSSVRGGNWLAFSSAKFALRGLVQSLARELWPQGIHVAHILVDGVIGEARETSSAAEPLLDPQQMAEAYWHLANQAPAAWSLELDLRPNRENFFE